MALFGLSRKAAPKISTQDNRLRIYSFNKYLRRVKGSALLCYLPQTVADEIRGQSTLRFSNEGLGSSWAKVLNELGYSVDIISWDDTEFKPDKTYDLVVFHGGKNFDNIFPKLAGETAIIHFLTGSYWKFNNQAEDARLKDFGRRHGLKAARDRYIYDSEDPVNQAADGIIVLGDPSMKDTYPKNLKVLTINNASYPDDHFDKVKKDYARARENFLFFAGAGNIHKGLDLLIDAFKDLKAHLYIVARPDKKVIAAFKNELQRPNIHLVGEINMRTAEFYEIMDKCAFVILPSSSEGQAGSVVEAMNQGLIPIVSKETRLDARGYGLVLKANSIQAIKQAVKKMSSLKPEEAEALAQKTRQTAIFEHNPDKFWKKKKKDIQEILQERW